MVRQISVEQFVNRLVSPVARAPLEIADGVVRCSETGRRFPVVEDVIDFVCVEELDETAKGELEGNDFLANDSDMEVYAHKYEDDAVAMHYTENDVALIRSYLQRIAATELCCLGAGGGMEVKRILEHYSLNRVYCSDIVLQKCLVVPRSVRDFDVEVALFASDFDHCPWGDVEVPVLIHQALHHTGAEMHQSLERLLRHGYRHVILTEPTMNSLVSFLRHLKLAQREEYSGVRPGRLELKRARSLANQYDYHLEVHTNWLFPKDYLRLFTRGNRRLEDWAMKAIDGLSYTTNPMSFGNNSVCFFSRN